VLVTASREDDGALAADIDDGAIPEPDGTLHRLVKLREHFIVPYHVICCTCVEVPALKAVVGAGSYAGGPAVDPLVPI
jgi:hypothetical protein